MIIAALVTFAILLVAWIVAPSGLPLGAAESMAPMEPAPLAEAA